jgi:hypothetical protein
VDPEITDRLVLTEFQNAALFARHTSKKLLAGRTELQPFIASKCSCSKRTRCHYEKTIKWNWVKIETAVLNKGIFSLILKPPLKKQNLVYIGYFTV